MIMELPFVCVEWEDPWADPTEVISAADAHVKHKPAIYETYGFLLYENDKGVSLTNEECMDDQDFRGRNFIHRSLIRSVTRYNLSRPRKPRTPTQSGDQPR